MSGTSSSKDVIEQSSYPPRPPRPPRPNRRPRVLPPVRLDNAPPAACSTGTSTATSQTGQLPAYCCDGFAEYDDSDLYVEGTDVCIRPDSEYVDPDFGSGFSLKLDLDGHQNMNTLQAPPSSAQASPSIFGEDPLNFDFTPSPPEHHSDTSIQSSSLSPANVRKEESNNDGSTDADQTRKSGLVAGRAILGLALKKFDSSARSLPQSAEKKVDPETADTERLRMPSTLRNKDAQSGTSSLPDTVSKGNRSDLAEAKMHLKLPTYHRGLRKQMYPPRVRYAEPTDYARGFLRLPSTRVASSYGPHPRCAANDHDLDSPPRSASDLPRSCSIR